MASEKTNWPGGLRFDEIGYWSEIKLDILRKYAHVYSHILSKKKFRYAYIDGFAGSGVHLSRTSGQLIPGSPLNALRVDPPFDAYFLIDLDGDKAEQLKRFPEIADGRNVHVINGDCNRILLEDVFPQIRYEDYRRALCVLDPYGLHLNWEVVRRAGAMKSIEIFLNFPIFDINRNALWRRPESVSVQGQERMTAYWGDDSWRQAAYRRQPTLFGDVDDVKLQNDDVVEAFAERLRGVAGFQFVPRAMPMRNSTNAVVYYLFFATQQEVAAKIFREITAKYGNRRG